MAEDAWNSKNLEKLSLAYTIDSEWRNRNVFINGREEIVSFLTKNGKMSWNISLKRNIGTIQTIG